MVGGGGGQVGGSGWWGDGLDVNAMLGVWGGDRWGVGLVGGGGGVGLDVNTMLGLGGDVGYGGCEPRVEGIVQGTKRYCTILRK